MKLLRISYLLTTYQICSPIPLHSLFSSFLSGLQQSPPNLIFLPTLLNPISPQLHGVNHLTQKTGTVTPTLRTSYGINEAVMTSIISSYLFRLHLFHNSIAPNFYGPRHYACYSSYLWLKEGPPSPVSHILFLLGSLSLSQTAKQSRTRGLSTDPQITRALKTYGTTVLLTMHCLSNRAVSLRKTDSHRQRVCMP